MRLRVRDICPDSRMFRDDGERLRAAIEARWDAEPVELDFESEPIASISFFDEGIATLFVDHDAETIRARLSVTGLLDGDRGLLNELVQRRRRQRAA